MVNVRDPARHHVVLVERLGVLFFDGRRSCAGDSFAGHSGQATFSRWVFVCETRSVGFMHLSIVYAPFPTFLAKVGQTMGLDFIKRGGALIGSVFLCNPFSLWDKIISIQFNSNVKFPKPRANLHCKSPQGLDLSACKMKVAIICSAQKQESRTFENFQTVW